MVDEILKQIKPTKKEEKQVKEKINSLLTELKKLKFNPILGGSGAKNTWLKGNHDIDVFVKFKKGEENISKKLEVKLKKKFKIEKLHGSRDYFRIERDNFTFEIVPIIDIKKASEAENITDISPLHYKWVNKHKKYTDDIRLIKAFAIAQKIYGAESYIQGFSGYALEILTIHYKGFNNLIKNVAKWKDKVIIDTEKHLKNPLKELNISKIQSPLILVDPVDKTRNAAAVLSKENFEKFKKACKKYLKKPNNNIFIEKEEAIPKDTVIIKFKTPTGKTDVIGAKLLKRLKFLIKQLNKEGFKIQKYGWNFTTYWFKPKYKKLPDIMEIKGPPLKMEKHVKKFKKIHKQAYIKKNKLYAKIKRKHPKIEDSIRFWIKYQVF
jgi:tRNA nucleotidyltransferase (CCA-adding enzyme)